MTTHEDVEGMGTRMSSVPSCVHGSSVFYGLTSIIDNNEESWKGNVPFPSAGMNANRWNVALGDLCATPKQSYSHMLNAKTSAGYNTNTYGKTPIVANVAGLPAALGGVELVEEGSTEMINTLADMVMSNLRFVGISMGNYMNGANGVQSPHVDGVPLSIMGPNTIMVPVKQEIEAFSFIVMTACQIEGGGGVKSLPNRVPISIKAFEGGSITQRMQTCVTAYDSLSDKLGNKADTTTSFHAMIDNQISGNKVFSQAVNIGNTYAEGAYGLCMKFLLILSETSPGKFNKDDLVACAEAIGFVPSGSVTSGYGGGGVDVAKLKEGLKNEFLKSGVPKNPTNNQYIDLLVYNAHNNISQAHGELFDQQTQIIGRILSQGQVPTKYAGSNLRKYNCIFNC